MIVLWFGTMQWLLPGNRNVGSCAKHWCGGVGFSFMPRSSSQMHPVSVYQLSNINGNLNPYITHCRFEAKPHPHVESRYIDFLRSLPFLCGPFLWRRVPVATIFSILTPSRAKVSLYLFLLHGNRVKVFLYRRCDVFLIRTLPCSRVLKGEFGGNFCSSIL